MSWIRSILVYRFFFGRALRVAMEESLASFSYFFQQLEL